MAKPLRRGLFNRIGLVVGEPIAPQDVTPEKLKGRWELVFSSVPHGIFRSSPFFEAIYDSYETVHESNCRGASNC